LRHVGMIEANFRSLARRAYHLFCRRMIVLHALFVQPSSPLGRFSVAMELEQRRHDRGTSIPSDNPSLQVLNIPRF
jgi:hypothetical protein